MGPLKWSKIWLSGTPKWNEFSILKILLLIFLEVFKVNLKEKHFSTNPNAHCTYGPNIKNSWHPSFNLNTTHNTAYCTAHCMMAIEYCPLLTDHSVQCTLHITNCAIHSAQCTRHNIHCKLHTTHCTLHTSQYTSHTIQCKVYTSLCSLYNNHWCCSLYTAFIGKTIFF